MRSHMGAYPIQARVLRILRAFWWLWIPVRRSNSCKNLIWTGMTNSLVNFVMPVKTKHVTRVWSLSRHPEPQVRTSPRPKTGKLFEYMNEQSAFVVTHHSLCAPFGVCGAAGESFEFETVPRTPHSTQPLVNLHHSLCAPFGVCLS
jgi:hypothetical protein